MKKFSISVLFLFIIVYSNAQKKPLDHSVYDAWQHIGEKLISNDGKWIVYTIDPQEGDNELVIQSADMKYKRSVSRGYNAAITADSRYVIFKIKPFYKDIRDAKIKNLRSKKKLDDNLPKDSIAIIELGKEGIWKREKVKGFKTPQKSSGWVAYILDEPIKQPGLPLKPNNWKDSTQHIADSLNHIIDSLQQVIESAPKKVKTKNKDDDAIDAPGDDPESSDANGGNDLVLRNITTGDEIVFYNAVEYNFSKANDKLVLSMARNPRDSSSVPQVLLYDCKPGRTITLSKGGNEFKNITMTDDGSQIAYVGEREARPKDLQKFYKLWYYKTGMDSATLLADKFSVGMKLGLTISEYATLNFSKSGRRLFFGTAPIQAPKDTALVDFDFPKVDVWHYNDDYLQTVQTFPAKLKSDLQQNYLAVYDLVNKTIKQLGTREIPTVLQTDEGDGDQFLGVTDFGKRIESQWRGNTLKDIYAINVNTGEKKLVKENLYGQAYPSSTGKYIFWYDRKAKDYFAWDGNTTRNISDKIKVPLYNEEFDQPDDPNNYGVMGWMEKDAVVFVYDKYDVWALDPSGEHEPVNFWGGPGRKNKLIYRYVQLDPDKKFFSFNDDVLLRAMNETTKAHQLAIAGMDPARFYPINLSSNGNYMISQFLAARNRPFTYIYTKENYNEPGDLYLAALEGKTDANNEKGIALNMHDVKLSSINPQQSNYLWGSAELFTWKAYNGKDATGIVYKPENFDPKKKYPMIVYFYEKLSDQLYDYKEPAPIRSAVNVPYFVSNGYIIFMPDIEYKVGHPGQSAYDYIVSGSRALVKKGWVDSTNMALQGHSWGGYQAAQLATMTKLFKAVWAGAPVANMTSAYGGIRWESGVSRQFQYEKSQSRIGGTLWEKLPLYIENSPLFHLDKVTVPMVIMSNDADGAVPWYQGIELFSGLRRLGKKVWLLDYNGQGHGLTQRQDMRDYQIRMQEFFDYMLKGAKPARWIIEGVPAVKKGKDWGLEVD